MKKICFDKPMTDTTTPLGELILFANKICDDWQVPHCPVEITNRVTRYRGRFHWGNVCNYFIDISGYILKHPYTRKTVYSTLLHELAHYLELQMYGDIERQDGGHGPRFWDLNHTLQTELQGV